MREDIEEIAAGHAIVAAAAVIEQGQALEHRPEDIAADAHAAAEEAYDLYLHIVAHAQADDAHAHSHTHRAIVGAGHPSSKPHHMKKPPNPHPSRGGPGQGLAGIYGQAEARLREAASVGKAHGGGGHGGRQGGGGGAGRPRMSSPTAHSALRPSGSGGAGTPRMAPSKPHPGMGMFGGGSGGSPPSPPPLGHLPFGGGGGSPHGPPIAHLPFSGGGGGGSPPPIAHLPFGTTPASPPPSGAPPAHLPGPPPHGGGGWPHHGWPHGHPGFGLGFGGGSDWGIGTAPPEVIDIEAECPPGMHLEGLDDGTVECVPTCPPGYQPEQMEDGSWACVPEPEIIVGHGGGGGGGGNHGGGGHGGWGGRGRRYWGGGYGYGYPYWPIVLACGPGQVMLADGSCANVAVGPVTVGAPMPSSDDGWEDGEPVCCGIDEDGTVTLPDGSTINAHDLDWSDLADAGCATVGDSTSDLPPFTSETPMPVAIATGTQAGGNAQADNLNLQWIALAQFLAANPQLGTNPTLPASYAPDVVSVINWLTTYADWQTFYSTIGTVSLSQLTGDLTGWQAYANAWGQYFQSLAPNQAVPANYPTGTAGIASLPSLSSILPSANSTANLLEWAVIAACVGVGLWVFWPVLAGAHGALAAV